jgi:uncharacterized BrkB/YihY/UPF0761 family membrane protein
VSCICSALVSATGEAALLDRYGLIGVAFSFQSWLLAAAFVIVVGAVIGAIASERMGHRLERIAR